jgi:lipoteichoic acid synthase
LSLQKIRNEILSFLKALLSRRDWAYLLSLLVPFVVYNLTLKASSLASIILSLPSMGWMFAGTLDLMRSDILFNLGYALVWIGIFAAAPRGPLRWTAVFLLHAVTILVVIISACAYQYFQETGTTLDYNIIAMWLPSLKENKTFLIGVISGVPLSTWAFFFVALLYAALGPWLSTRFVGRWRGWPERPPSVEPSWKVSFFGPLGLCCLALVLVSLSVPVESQPASFKNTLWGFSKSFVRNSFVNMVVTAAQAVNSEESADVAAVEPLPSPASLVPTSGSERRNVVLIHLESTRARSVTPYNEDLDTTPFLDKLAKSSLLAEQAYVVMPWSSKANVAIVCGIPPHLAHQAVYSTIAEARPGGIPTRCLADLLKDHGYNTVYFMSQTQNFENYSTLVKNFGYEEFYPLESMDKEGFEKVMYAGQEAGYEDDIMLTPSEEWLENHKDVPFLATYHTATPHHQYIVPNWYEERSGRETFSNDELLNRYLNTLRYQDYFLKNLIDQYKKLGLYENTVFIILGDHGEGFGEHGRYTHGSVPYEEGLRIPLIIHDPKRFENGARVKEPVTQLDILPTVANLLGYQIEGGEYQGSSLLRALPKDRALMFSCHDEHRCMASIKGNKKYIYHYDNQPDELFDLSEDPLEKHNLADEGGQELEERRRGLLAWRARIDALYRGPQRK